MLAASVRNVSLPLNQLNPSGKESSRKGLGSLMLSDCKNFNLFPRARLDVPQGGAKWMKAI
jgi:hypothetical protein